MIIHTLPVPSSSSTSPAPITATPLTREAFAPFGFVASNPAPASLPHNTSPSAVAAGALPCGAASANQGTAIQYRDLGRLADWYGAGRAPSGRRAAPRLTMFVCGARALRRREAPSSGGGGGSGSEGDSNSGSFFEVKILERHPFTTQTFAPLGVDPAGPRRYLVIVAPTLSTPDANLSAPAPALTPTPTPAPSDKDEAEEARNLPGPGLPDLARLRAFVATGAQAVTYGAGTWHAPMVALGPAGTALDFVVTQFANGVPVEDCQEVVLRRQEGLGEAAKGGGNAGGEGDGDGKEDEDSSGVWVRIPDDDALWAGLPKL